MDLSRRTFLKGAGLAGAAALAAGPLSGCRVWLPPQDFHDRGRMLDGPAADAPIDHVVIVMMENRSFDHYLGWLADDADYLEAGRRRYGRSFAVTGAQQQTYPGPDGPVATMHLVGAADEPNPYRGCGHPDPGHSWTAGRAERDGGFLAPASGNDEFALGYYLGDDLPFTTAFARRFTVCDDWHASLLGPTYPNREYLHAAQSGGYKTNYLPIAEGGFSWPTIWDRLAAAGVPARYYYSDLPVLALFGTRMNGFLHPVADYYTDCDAGTLPNVTMLDPKFLEPGENDDHPLADVRAGQLFLRDAFKAFVDSPHWEHGLFVVTYDEWGGFFDHVPPPILHDDRASTVDADNFGQAGFRVPAMLASPYAPRGYADHTLYDHTSILRFLEWRFLGAPAEGPGDDTDTWFLTARDRNAHNIGRSLTRRPVSTDLRFDLDALAIGTPSPPCEGAPPPGLDGAPARLDAAAAAPPGRSWEQERALEYFERVKAPLVG